MTWRLVGAAALAFACLSTCGVSAQPAGSKCWTVMHGVTIRLDLVRCHATRREAARDLHRAMKAGKATRGKR